MGTMKKTYLTHADVITLLRQKQGAASMEEFAAAIGITNSLLYMVYLGKRKVGSKIMKFLGLEKVVLYKR
jgi:hypothetical protein